MSEPKPVKAAKSEKMFEIRIRFWTACMDDDPEKVLPKHGWDSGMLHVTANDTHDLRSIEAVPFHSLMDLPRAIEKVILECGTLHQSHRSRKYSAEPDPKAESRKKANALAKAARKQAAHKYEYR